MSRGGDRWVSVTAGGTEMSQEERDHWAPGEGGSWGSGGGDSMRASASARLRTAWSPVAGLWIGALAGFGLGWVGHLEAQTHGLEALASELVEAGSPAAGVLLVENGVVHFAVTGERIHGSGIPVERGDRWHLGSNGKAMTAVLAGRLVEKGILDWETPLAHVDEAARWGPLPDWAARATLVELLSHTAGMPANLPAADAMAILGPDRERDARVDRLHFARRILAGEPGGPPGAFLYSNAGYVMAAILMEVTTGSSWEELVHSEVFSPLGLSSGGMGPPGVDGTRDAPSEPWGHLGGMGDLLLPIPPEGLADNPPAMSPAGRIHMTLEDYGAFLTTVLEGIRGDRAVGSPELLSTETWVRLITPPPGSPGYALGWGIVAREDGTPAGCPVYQHAGSNGRWWAHVRLDPVGNRGVVVVLNEGRVERVRGPSTEILERLAPLPTGDCRIPGA